MKTSISLFTLLLGLFLQIHAQVFSSQLIDEEGNGLEGVVVTLKGSSIGTLSDSLGRFTIQLPEDGRLAFHFIGREDLELNFQQLDSLKDSPIELRAKDIQMRECEIVANRPLIRNPIVCCLPSRSRMIHSIRTQQKTLFSGLSRNIDELIIAQQVERPLQALMPQRGPANTFIHSIPLSSFMGIPGMDPALSLLSPKAFNLRTSSPIQSFFSDGWHGINGRNDIMLKTGTHKDLKAYSEPGVQEGGFALQSGIQGHLKGFADLDVGVHHRSLPESSSGLQVSLTQGNFRLGKRAFKNKLHINLMGMSSVGRYQPRPLALASGSEAPNNFQLFRVQATIAYIAVNKGHHFLKIQTGSALDANMGVGQASYVQTGVSWNYHKYRHNLRLDVNGLGQHQRLRNIPASTQHGLAQVKLTYDLGENIRIKGNGIHESRRNVGTEPEWRQQSAMLMAEYHIRVGEQRPRELLRAMFDSCTPARERLRRLRQQTRTHRRDNCAPSREALKLGLGGGRAVVNLQAIHMLSASVSSSLTSHLHIHGQVFRYLPSESEAFGYLSPTQFDQGQWSKWGGLMSISCSKRVKDWDLNVSGRVATDRVALMQLDPSANIGNPIWTQEKNERDWAWGLLGTAKHGEMEAYVAFQQAPFQANQLGSTTFWETGLPAQGEGTPLNYLIKFAYHLPTRRKFGLKLTALAANYSPLNGSLAQMPSLSTGLEMMLY